MKTHLIPAATWPQLEFPADASQARSVSAAHIVSVVVALAILGAAVAAGLSAESQGISTALPSVHAVVQLAQSSSEAQLIHSCYGIY